MKAIVETYAASRNELNPKTLRGKLTKCWDPVMVYADPFMRVQGSKKLPGYMMKFHKSMPGVRLVNTNLAERYSQLHLRWKLVDDNKNVLQVGNSFGGISLAGF